MAVVVLPFVLWGLGGVGFALWNAPRTGALETVLALGSSLVVLAIMAAVARAVSRRLWTPFRVRVDRDAGEFEIVERNVLTGKERRDCVALISLAGMNVQTMTALVPSPAASKLASFTPNVRVTLRIDEGRRTPRRRAVSLGVAGVDRREEVADLAYRLGAAAGLPYQRLVRSDPRDIELDLSPAMGPGYERLPALETRADYERDVVIAAAVAAAAEERVPPFDPAQFPSDHKVTRWSPGREVRFHKPLGGAAIGCLPFAVAGLAAGPLVFILISQRPDVGLADRLVPSAFFGLFGLVLGGIASVAVASAMPRRVTIDWAGETISIGGPFSRLQIATREVAALEARGVRTRHSGGKNSSPYNGYHCEVLIHPRDGSAAGSKPVLLVRTTEFREDPDTPYRRTLPLVTELAEALAVERRVSDFGPASR